MIQTIGFLAGLLTAFAFLPQVIIAVEGLIGIVVLIIGLMLAVFGVLICKD